MKKRMGLAAALMAGTMGLAMLGAASAQAATFKWANDGDANSMDPYSRDETFLLTFTANIYDPLIMRDRHLKLIPGLATDWQQTGPTTWRFHLRHGVKFTGGEPFTADDVVFSFTRATTGASDLKGFFASVKDAKKIDDYTVDFEMKHPDPIFPQEITQWGIMSKAWCTAHDATETASLNLHKENYATRHADGTGPFMLVSREPDRRTTLKANPNWWGGKARGNVTDAELDIISNAATRVAALISGDVDMIYSVPPQDVARLKHTAGLNVIEGPELRTIFLGFDQSRNQLLYSDVKGKNPFKDERVRQAFNEAVNIQAIHRVVMRGESHPTGLMYGPGVNGYTKESDVRWPYNPADAKKLLTAAGYPNGFGVTLDCPNDRYVNDAQICQAVAAMLAKIGVRVSVNAQTKLKYFAQIGAPGYRTSFYMLGWTPATYDALNAMYNLAGTRNGVRGMFNYGGYSNPKLDSLLDKIAVDTNPESRQGEIEQASKVLHDDAAFIPLHQQVIVWAAKDSIDLAQLADNTFPLRYVSVKGK